MILAYTGDRTCGEKQKACDVNKELADDAAEKAVSKMMQRMQAENDRREGNLFSRLQVSLKSAAEDAVWVDNQGNFITILRSGGSIGG